MNEKTRHFIETNLNADIRQLALQGSKDPEVDLPLALRQIAGRQTARRKLPSWAALDGLLFPPHLNMEQCSSEQTARYKADICRRRRPHRRLWCGLLVDEQGLRRGYLCGAR